MLTTVSLVCGVWEEGEDNRRLDRCSHLEGHEQTERDYDGAWVRPLITHAGQMLTN